MTGGPGARRRPRGWSLVLAVLTALWCAGTAGLVGLAHGGQVPDDVAGPWMILFTTTAAVAAVCAARSRRLDERTRGAWRCLATGFALLLLSNATFAFTSSFPSPGDALRLLAVAPLLVGLLRLPRASRTSAERTRLLLDIGVVVAGGFMALWYFSLGPLLAGTGPGTSALALLTAAAYPLADLVLLLGATTALMRGVEASVRRPLVLVAAGLGLLIGGDLMHTSRGTHGLLDGVGGGGSSSPAVEWLLLLSGFCLLACAAVEQCRAAGGVCLGAPVERPARSVSRVPYVAVGCGFALLLVVAVRDALYPWAGLVGGAVAMTGLVVARQVLALQENHRLLVTDHLTGLTTRAELRAEVSRSLARAQRTGGRTAVLVLDMDGFKQINDEHGHEAGDEALVGFAGVLRASASRSDVVGRLGGDEFAVVLPAGDRDDAVALARAVLEALAVPVPVAGQPVRLGASVGVALSEPGDTPRELLHRADGAMYRAKRDRLGWALAAPGLVPVRLPSQDDRAHARPADLPGVAG